MELLTPGNVISIIIFVTGLIAQYMVMDRRVTRLEARSDHLEKSGVKLETDILKRLEKLEEKLDKLIDRKINNHNG